MDIFDILFTKKLAYKEAKAESDKELNSLIDGSITSIDYEGTTIRGHAFDSCTRLTTARINKATQAGTYSFSSCTALTTVEMSALYTIPWYMFNGCTSFDTLIIRKATVMPLGNVNTFNNTPFASNGTGGTLYVPQSVIENYRSADNWSTILEYPNNQIKAIEGSEYEI